MRVSPILMRSPELSFDSRMRWPLRSVPLRLSRSWSQYSSPSRLSILMCRRDVIESRTWRAAEESRPMRIVPRTGMATVFPLSLPFSTTSRGMSLS